MIYARAPITEAVIDIRVAPRPELPVDELRKVIAGFSEHYPQVRDQFRISGAMVVEMQNPVEVQNSSAVQREKVGVQFMGAQGDRLFSAQTSGYSFNKMAPYESWEAFRNEGRQIWLAYRKIVQPSVLTRIGLRYVNRLDLPLPFDDFRTYLHTTPEIGSGMPQALSNFFMQLQIPYPELEALAILNMAMVPPATEGSVSIVLDIDIFRTSNVPQDEEGLWSFAEQLRHAKNAIFEACITDATRELFR